MTKDNGRANRLEAIPIAGLVICILPLCLHRLGICPAPWFDEGLNFRAAKNIALNGHYGLRSAEGFVGFHPAIQTGPTVLLPMALVFRLAGTGVVQARLVTVFYTVLALAIFYVLARWVRSCGFERGKAQADWRGYGPACFGD
jgi:4-amino-4-deoxy-L-arabinose transferase-like glycosyltransferase